MEEFIFSINTILPVFLMILLGKYMNYKDVISNTISHWINEMSYHYLMPILLFYNISQSDFSSMFDPGLIVFCITSIVITFTIVWTLAAIFLPDKKMTGAFVQGCMRGNYVLLGITIMTNLFGPDKIGKSAVVLPFIVATYSILSVTVLTFYRVGDSAKGKWKKVLIIARDIIRNPFIIAILIGFPFCLISIQLPFILLKPIEYLAQMATPVALIGMGAALNITGIKRTIKVAITAAIVKTIVLPSIVIPIAILYGYRDVELGIIMVFSLAPTAVNSYATAKSLGNDADLAANIILISTVMSCFIMVSAIFLLKSLHYIS